VQQVAWHSSAVAQQEPAPVSVADMQVGLGQAPVQQRNPDPSPPHGVPLSTATHCPLLPQVWHSGQLLASQAQLPLL
jgi:hypothetical protein